MSPPTYTAQVHNADVERLCALQASLDGEPALPDSAVSPPFVTRSHSDAAVRGYLSSPWPGLIARPAFVCCGTCPPRGHSVASVARSAGLHPLRISLYARAAGSRDTSIVSVSHQYLSSSGPLRPQRQTSELPGVWRLRAAAARIPTDLIPRRLAAACHGRLRSQNYLAYLGNEKGVPSGEGAWGCVHGSRRL
jgi:hypothetical protein